MIRIKFLKGIQVLDLTRFLSGPYCTKILAEMGAEVIKVERPVYGDDTRGIGPFIKGESSYFMGINSSKKSITLNLKKEKGVEILKKLIAESDVLVQNFKPGFMESLGLTYDEIKRINPGIIYACLSGFGQTGPMKDKAAYDIIIQAMGGIMSITGQEENQFTRVGTSIGDLYAGMYLSIGILGSLMKRSRTGEGEMIDVAMLDCQISILENAISRCLVGNEVPKPIGNRHPSVYPLDTFETLKGDIVIAIGNDKLWSVFCRVVGREDLISDPKYSTNAERNTNSSQLKKTIEEIFSSETAEYWEKKLIAASIPSARINTIEDVVNNEQIRHRQMIEEVEDDFLGSYKIISSPIKVMNSEKEDSKPYPRVGEHVEEILTKYITLEEDFIEELRKDYIV